MSTQTRQPAGVPVGGQFATTSRDETDVVLDAPRTTDIMAAELGVVVGRAFSLEVEGQTVCLEANSESDLGVFVRHDAELGPVSAVGYGPDVASWSVTDATRLAADVLYLDEWEEDLRYRGLTSLTREEVLRRQGARASAAAPLLLELAAALRTSTAPHIYRA